MTPDIMQLTSIAFRMSSHGLLIDRDLRAEMAREYAEKLAEMAAVYPDINLRSVTREVPAYLFGVLKAPTKTRTTSKHDLYDVIDALEGGKHPEPDHPAIAFCEHLLSFRKLDKIRGTYLVSPIDADGRMRSGLNPSGTETGRWSSSRSVLRSGSNVQNIPDELRCFIVAPEGSLLTKADLQQAEMRLLAYITGETELINAFENNVDVHAVMAIKQFPRELGHLSPNDPAFSKDGSREKELRRRRKTITYLKNYGGGPEVLRKKLREAGLKFTKEETAQFLAADRRAFPALAAYERQCTGELEKGRRITLPTGQVRTFLGRAGPDLTREFVNWQCQGTVAWMMNRAIIRIDRELNKQNLSQLVVQLHDEMTAEGSSRHAKSVRALFVKYMTEPVPIRTPNGISKISIPAEAKSDRYWVKPREEKGETIT
jgi:DNA polymerase-1